MDTFYGRNPEAVVGLIKQRKGCRSDSGTRRIALVIEGGGMRGVLSAGALLALDIMGYRECFDGVFAMSAGGVNAAYFLSEQGALGITVYFEDLNDSRFLNPWRIWKMLDVDYVYDDVVTKSKPLDESAVRSAHATFYVTLTHATDGVNVLHDVTHSLAPIPQVLKASSALPVLYNRTVAVNGQPFVDGGVSGGPPLDWAIRLGFTDIFFLSTRPKDFSGKPPNSLEKLVFRIFIGNRYPGLLQAFLSANIVKTQIQRFASGLDLPEGVNVATFHAEADAENVIERTTTNKQALLRGARKSALTLARLFDGDVGPLIQMFDRLEARE